MNRPPLLRVENLHKAFELKGSFLSKKKERIHAVNGISFTLAAGETLGLVGESGSGKSTLARLVMQLLPADQGEVTFLGQPLSGLSFSEMIRHRRAMQMIFQDPQDSLNSRMTVEDIILEPLDIATKPSRAQRAKELARLLELVGLDVRVKSRFPHEFSGGQRQRIGIARALALNPKLIIADEPVSALDVSIQAQVLNLLKDLQERLGVSYLFIAHDIHVIFFISQKIAVAYLGQIMEQGSRDTIRDRAGHPYTQVLLDSIPKPDPAQAQQLQGVQGEIPSLIQLPLGCKFHPRCPRVEEKCKGLEPLLQPLRGDSAHLVACHFPLEAR